MTSQPETKTQSPESASDLSLGCPVLSAEKFSIRRESPGYYAISKGNVTGRIFQYDEGTWKGWWLVDWSDGVYYDPVQTLREAKHQAQLREV